jgi:hypothetical protein
MTKPALISVLAALAFAVSPAISQAAEDKPSKPAAKAKPGASKKKASKKKAAPEMDVSGLTAVEYNCAEDHRLTVFRDPTSDKPVALRWNKRIHPMTHVETETGADRMENTEAGLVWIGIPAKAMLLDSKKGQKLANECMKPDQVAQ